MKDYQFTSMLDAARPAFGPRIYVKYVGEYTEAQTEAMEGHPTHYSYEDKVYSSMGTARNACTKYLHYSNDTMNVHAFFYVWDAEDEFWQLDSYVAKGTKGADLPWRKKKTK